MNDEAKLLGEKVEIFASNANFTYMNKPYKPFRSFVIHQKTLKKVFLSSARIPFASV
jgi:hypothetical protein